jgi:hypothetical protein
MTATHASLLLPFNQDNSAITTATHAQNLLLFFVRNDPAITMANHANSKLQLIDECLFLLRDEDNSELQLIVDSYSTGTEQVTPATIRNDSFKLNDTLASEGAHPAPTILSDKLCGFGLIVDFIPTTSNPLLPSVLNGAIASAHRSNLHVEYKSKLIVICFKIFLHFREDCGTFCEGERDDPGINGLVKSSGFTDFIGFVVLVGLVGFVGLSCLKDLLGLVGLIEISSRVVER